MLAHLITGRYGRLGPDEPYTTRVARGGWFARLMLLFARRR
jgi:hypothetical protein